MHPHCPQHHRRHCPMFHWHHRGMHQRCLLRHHCPNRLSRSHHREMCLCCLLPRHHLSHLSQWDLKEKRPHRWRPHLRRYLTVDHNHRQCHQDRHRYHHQILHNDLNCLPPHHHPYPTILFGHTGSGRPNRSIRHYRSQKEYALRTLNSHFRRPGRQYALFHLRQLQLN